MSVDPLSLPPEPSFEFTPVIYSVGPAITRLDSGKTVAPTVSLFTNDYAYAHAEKRKTFGDGRFFATNERFDDIRFDVIRSIADLVRDEHPRLFHHAPHAYGGSFMSELTGDLLFYDKDGGASHSSLNTGTNDAFDVLGSLLQSDIAVMRMIDGRDDLVAANVRLPSHWTPSEKIGMDFDEIHKHVPEMQRNGNRIVRAMIHGPRGERFAFGVDADAAYTHTDRDALPLVPVEALHLTYERQTWIGNPEQQWTAFFIHKAKRPFVELSNSSLRNVAHWKRSMKPEARVYKRLQRADEFATLIDSYVDKREARR